MVMSEKDKETDKHVRRSKFFAPTKPNPWMDPTHVHICMQCCRI